MDSSGSTYAPIAAFVEELVHAGVQHVCVSPGARSTPLTCIMATQRGLRAWSHVDERSGAFFGLGIAKVSERPVALVCTSGTAAANFLPAVIEAAHAHVPLLVLTADRPPELRDCGAPQTIDQLKLYGSHVKWFAEAGMPETGTRYFRALACRAVAVACAAPAGPVHINFPFREPLVPAPTLLGPAARPDATHRPYTVVHRPEIVPEADTVRRLSAFLTATPRGLIACGPGAIDPATAAAIAALAQQLGYPVLADPLSQMRTGQHDTRLIVGSYDALLRNEDFAARMAPGAVLRIGPLPTSKAFAQYLQRHPQCRQIVVDPAGPWNDPALTAAEIVRADVPAVCAGLQRYSPSDSSATADNAWTADWMKASRLAAHTIAAQLDAMAELFDGKVFAELAALLPDDALLYVGNSMPVRDLESFWPVGRRRVRFLANRGANGIDGFVSSGLGAAAVSPPPLVMVTGDLGFYHDLNGLLAVKRHGIRATIIVLNNDGGGIFSFLPQADCGESFAEFFLTPHGLDFRGAAEMYGAGFTRIASWEQFRDAVTAALGAPRATVIEVPTDRARNVELHRALWAAARHAVSPGVQ
jgi:2-succinyl-5-enolpyruvyl-6-hydroxy-3-cyclohexene-1-carboxylate synthase